MNIKNTILTALMVVVFGVAVIMILYVSDAITKEGMNEMLTKGGWAVLIITAAMVVAGLIKQAGKK